MGQPKLLLPWGNWTMIDQLLSTWTTSAVDATVVVVRNDDHELKTACSRWPVHIVQAVNPPRDMKESVQIGLRYLEEHWQPKHEDCCFVAPADLPGLPSHVIDRLIEMRVDSATITIPQYGERQGHPALLPWPVIQQVFDLAEDEGVNQVVIRNPKHVVPFPSDTYVPDVDTPEEYRLLRAAQVRRPDK